MVGVRLPCGDPEYGFVAIEKRTPFGVSIFLFAIPSKVAP